MRFEDPTYLWLLCLLPLLFLLRVASHFKQRKRLRRLGDPQLLRQLMPDVSRARRAVKFWLMMGALAMLILVLARPQMGTHVSHDKRQGIEAIICMDISNSMLAEDVVPSRLEKSKMLVENMIDHFRHQSFAHCHARHRYRSCHTVSDAQFHAGQQYRTRHHRHHRW